MLLNAAKFQRYSFYRFWVIKGKPTWGGGGEITPPPTQIRVKIYKPVFFKSIFLDWNAYMNDRNVNQALKFHTV